MTPMNCQRSSCGEKWRAQDMLDIFCRECGGLGASDDKLILEQRRFDASAHEMIEKGTGQPRGRRSKR
jgi:hypothetical protein